MENISAAIPILDLSNTLSEREFQEMLSSWLEEKGVLSDLRSQLRFKMVNALRDTAIGSNIDKRNYQGNSLSKQAFNIIIAEFLMQNKCYYSLSLFNMEAGLTHILPDLPIIFDNGKMSNEVNRLDKENVLNIMELIGIVKSSSYCEEVLTRYFSEQEHNSLLSCIVSLLCKLINQTDGLNSLNLGVNSVEYIQDFNIEDTFIKQIVNILHLSGLAGKNFKTAIEGINTVYRTESKNIETEYTKLINDLKIENGNYEEQTRQMFKTNKMLKSQLLKITRDYKKLKLTTRNLISNEKVVKGYNTQENKNKDLTSTLPNMNENDKISKFSEAVQTPNIACQLQHCSEVCKNYKITNDDLMKQNRYLLEENKQQKEEITKITLKYKQLLSEFTVCQQKICLLNSKLNGEYSEELVINVLYGDTPLVPAKVNTSICANDDSSDNITQEILHEARLRLKQLEEETKTIEEKCKLLHLTGVE